jgi:hypothetical protein
MIDLKKVYGTSKPHLKKPSMISHHLAVLIWGRFCRAMMVCISAIAKFRPTLYDLKAPEKRKITARRECGLVKNAFRKLGFGVGPDLTTIGRLNKMLKI